MYKERYKSVFTAVITLFLILSIGFFSNKIVAHYTYITITKSNLMAQALINQDIKKSKKTLINKSFITKTDLNNLDLKDVNKLVIVAHPDDESLWGAQEIKDNNYLVVCLTDADNKIRREEFEKAIRKLGAKGIILPYPDANGFKRVDWKKEKIMKYIKADVATAILYKRWDKILTHNPEGEYGHLHHIYTNRIVKSEYKKYINKDNLYYFGKYYNKNELKRKKKHLTRLSDEQIKDKMDLLDVYDSQAEAFVKYGHMIPYERIINAKSFK